MKGWVWTLMLFGACKHLEKDGRKKATPPVKQDPQTSDATLPSGGPGEGSTPPPADVGSSVPPTGDASPTMVTYSCRIKSPSQEADWCFEITIAPTLASRYQTDLCSPGFDNKQFTDYRWSDQTCQSTETAGGGCQFSSVLRGWIMQSFPDGLRKAYCDRVAFLIVRNGYETSGVQLIDAKP